MLVAQHRNVQYCTGAATFAIESARNIMCRATSDWRRRRPPRYKANFANIKYKLNSFSLILTRPSFHQLNLQSVCVCVGWSRLRSQDAIKYLFEFFSSSCSTSSPLSSGRCHLVHFCFFFFILVFSLFIFIVLFEQIEMIFYSFVFCSWCDAYGVSKRLLLNSEPDKKSKRKENGQTEWLSVRIKKRNKQIKVNCVQFSTNAFSETEPKINDFWH